MSYFISERVFFILHKIIYILLYLFVYLHLCRVNGLSPMLVSICMLV